MPTSTVYVIDDDKALRDSLVFLLEGEGVIAQSYGLAADFLAAYPAEPEGEGCILLDIRMPDISGIELQRKLVELGWKMPVVFITGHGDIEMAVQAMKHGAFDFLTKPFKDEALLGAVKAALHSGRAAQQDTLRRQEAEALLARLSPRELEVARLVAQGLPNKLIASELQISEKTVHIHRHRVLEKTEAGNAAELTRLMMRADPKALE